MKDFPTLTLELINARCAEGMSAGFFTIIPNVARVVLETSNKVNRKYRHPAAAKIGKDMLEGRFQLNGESIIFSDSGSLNDGQHRLGACAVSGVPFIALVAFGLPPNSMGTVDLGTARRAGDFLSFSGLSNANVVAAAARVIIAFESADGENIGETNRVSSTQIVEFVENRPEIVEDVIWAEAHRKFVAGLATTSLLAVARFILGEEYGRDRVDEFLDQVVYGENISRGQPAFATRTRLQRLSPRRNSNMLEAIFRGWLAELRGASTSTVPILGELPRLINEKRREAMLSAIQRKSETEAA